MFLPRNKTSILKTHIEDSSVRIHSTASLMPCERQQRSHRDQNHVKIKNNKGQASIFIFRIGIW